MKPHDLARALETVPEKRLRLLELAQECVDSEGNVDFERCLPLATEIEEAIEESQEYAHETEKMRWELRNIMGR